MIASKVFFKHCFAVGSGALNEEDEPLHAAAIVASDSNPSFDITLVESCLWKYALIVAKFSLLQCRIASARRDAGGKTPRCLAGLIG